MAINSINSYTSNRYYNSLMSARGVDYAALNDEKLAAVFEKHTGSSTGSSSALTTDTKTFLKDYQSEMTNMMSAASDVMNISRSGLAAASSDTAVATAKVRYSSAQQGEYQLNVSQIATRQVNRSEAVSASGANSMEGTLTIRSNRMSDPLTIDMADFAGKATNKDALAAAAEKINSSTDATGVTASVVEKDGNVSLELSSAETGAANAFVTAGSFAESSGLAVTAQSAQNAVYSINGGEEKTSSENSISLGNYKVEATLTGTGKATISVGPDTERTATALQKLVDGYNSALTFLNNNAGVGSGVLTQMKNMLTMPISEKSMEKVGITSAKDGTLVFDKKTYLEAAKNSPSLTSSIVGGSYSIAQGIYNDGKSGMSIPSRSLLSNTPYASVSNQWSQYSKNMNNDLYSTSNYRTYYNYTSSMSLLNMLI